jgi:plasmid stabilization system protein ParE
MATAVITARLDAETLALVDKVSKAQGRSRSWFAARAIKQAAEAEAELQAFIQVGIDSADRGELTPYEEVEPRSLNIKLTAPAISDLKAVRAWLEREASPAIAADQLGKITATFDRLRDFPALGSAATGSIRRKSVLRSPWLLFYRIDPDEVIILRIRHNREDWLGA